MRQTNIEAAVKRKRETEKEIERFSKLKLEKTYLFIPMTVMVATDTNTLNVTEGYRELFQGKTVRKEIKKPELIAYSWIRD